MKETVKQILDTTAVDYPKFAEFLVKAMHMPLEVSERFVDQFDDANERAGHMVQACFLYYLQAYKDINLVTLKGANYKELFAEHWESFLSTAVISTFRKR